MIWVFPTLIAFIIATFKDIFKKKILAKIEPIQFVLIFYTAHLLIAQATLSKISVPSTTEFSLIALAALCYCLANLIGLKVLKEIRISVFKPLSGLSALLVLIFSITFLNETINVIKSIGIILILIPLFILTKEEFKFKEINKKYFFLLILGLTFEAFATILDRIILRTVNAFSYFYFLKLFLVILFTIVMFSIYKLRISLIFLKENALKIGLVALFTSTGAYAYFFAMADPLANAGVIKVILSSSLIFTTLIGGVYFKEKHLLFKVGISIISIAGIAILFFT